MKKFSFKTGLVAMAGMLSLAVLFSACKKNTETQTVPVAGLMTFNLAPDKAAVGFSISGNTLGYAPLGYAAYTGYYMNIYPGQRTVAAFDQAGVLDSTAYNFTANKYYSAFLVGANGKYRTVVVDDHIDTLSAPNGVAYLRYVNAIPDSTKPTVSVTVNGTAVVNSAAAFGSVSGFTPVQAGQATIALSNEGSINTNRTVTLESGKVYTVILQGIPGQTDQDKTVQIRYITNGRVTP